MFFNFYYFRKQFLFGKKINVRKNTFFAKIFYFFKKGVCFTNSFLFAKKPIINLSSAITVKNITALLLNIILFLLSLLVLIYHHYLYS